MTLIHQAKAEINLLETYFLSIPALFFVFLTAFECLKCDWFGPSRDFDSVWSADGQFLR